ncbi:hypothetical protein D030_5148A, partial [Vibrio parahaemolyticus AQ3810]
MTAAWIPKLEDT